MNLQVVTDDAEARKARSNDTQVVLFGGNNQAPRSLRV